MIARLFDLDGLWEVVKRSDPIINAIADRHYPRRSRGCGHVGGPGEVLILRSIDHAAGWITLYTIYPDDGLDAWRCTMFRNEGELLSSDLIAAAMQLTRRLWNREPPPDGWLTYVDTRKVKSANPGYCFKRAGWWLDRSYHPGRRQRGLIRLRSHDEAFLQGDQGTQHPIKGLDVDQAVAELDADLDALAAD